MEQVAKNHGVGISEIRATCVDDLLKSPREVEPPTSFQQFYDFPALCGYKVEEDFTLSPSRASGKHQSPSYLIQGWLFFGLISTVVQSNQKPVLALKDLCGSVNNLSTECLHEAIEEWTNSECHRLEGLRFRLIQVGWVLDLARQVIQKNFPYEVDDADAGEQPSDLQVSEKTILVLMCLGETLSAAKARIVEKTHVDTMGWHGDGNVGWGPPRYVFEQMKEKGWCPRAVEILRGQVNSNATMLVAAYQAYQKSSRMTDLHDKKGCTRQECKVKSTDEKGNYQNQHLNSCRPKTRKCNPCGPSEDKVLEVLRDGGIPLLVFCNDNNEEGKFKVISLNPEDECSINFVTISHVWSDGWGNEGVNKLNSCQVDFIQRHIKRATGRADTPFWMDTLVVPVAKGQEEYRKKAIRQICNVFSRSSHTIILDNGLSSMDKGGAPAETAMKIFSSVWMRRLWTLQEAYLSRSICVPFEEEDVQSASNLVTFEKLEGDLENAMMKTGSGITHMVRAQLSRMVMGEERQSMRGPANKRDLKKRRQKDDVMEVANAYRAARWRTTGKAEHEVLALATLLRLNTEKTKIEEAGLDAPGTAGPSFDVDRLDELVSIFWDELHKQRKGVIPSGMIFLPGEKVNREGFGWAPRTWFSTYEMDYPDPLSFWGKSTELDTKKGLGIEYPGFLLHPDSLSCRSSILGTAMGSDPFTFPVDRSLNEWYSFQRLDDPENGQRNEITRQERDKTQLAIILSGPLPRESPREVALLVEVTEQEAAKTSDETGDWKAVEYHASIIHRVLIWRGPNYMGGADDKLQFKMGSTGVPGDKHVCLGEVLSPSQRWWVDRPVNPKMGHVQTQMEDTWVDSPSVSLNQSETLAARAWAFLGAGFLRRGLS